MRDGVDDFQGHQPLGQQPQGPAPPAQGRWCTRQGDEVGLLLAVQLAAVLAPRWLPSQGAMGCS